MHVLEFNTSVKCGLSKRKVEEIYLSFGDLHCLGDTNDWVFKVFCAGKISVDKQLTGNSAFDCVALGMACLRQLLQQFLIENPKMKLYEDVEGDLEKIDIKDIFWTHDCISDEMEEMNEWAKENGFESE